MKVFQRVVSAVFPRHAALVAESRARIAQAEFLRTAFDAANLRDRTRARNPRLIGPIAETAMGRLELVALARDLDRNNSWVHGVFNAIANNVVGTGIRLEAQVEKRRKDSRLPPGPGGVQFDTTLNQLVEDGWKRWTDAVDVNRQVSFTELQWEIERELDLVGEVLVLFGDTEPTDTCPVSLTLKVVSTEQLDATDRQPTTGGVEVLQGIEYAADGRILAYHIWPRDPADSMAPTSTPVRVPATRVLHLRKRGRPGLIRGLPGIHAVARTVEALGQYLDHELTRARTASAFALMVKRGGIPLTLPQASDSDEATSTSTSDVPEGLLAGGGLILQGGPNDGFESAGPNIPSTAFEPFVKLMLRSAAVGLNVSYGFLARDHSDSNFSAARQEYLEDLKHWRPRQQFLTRRLCVPVFKEFVYRAATLGLPGFSLSRDLENQVRWRTQGWEWVDPQKEIEADVTAIQNGLKSPQEVCQERGRDFYEVVDQLAEAKSYAEQQGVTLTIFGLPMKESTDGEEEDGSKDKEGGVPGNAKSNGNNRIPTRATR